MKNSVLSASFLLALVCMAPSVYASQDKVVFCPESKIEIQKLENDVLRMKGSSLKPFSKEIGLVPGTTVLKLSEDIIPDGNLYVSRLRTSSDGQPYYVQVGLHLDDQTIQSLSLVFPEPDSDQNRLVWCEIIR